MKEMSNMTDISIGSFLSRFSKVGLHVSLNLKLKQIKYEKTYLLPRLDALMTARLASQDVISVLSGDRALFCFSEVPLVTAVVDFVCARCIAGDARWSTIMQFKVFAVAWHSHRRASETRVVAPVTEPFVTE